MFSDEGWNKLEHLILLTTWGRILIGNLKVNFKIEKLPAFYGTQRRIPVFTTVCHETVS